MAKIVAFSDDRFEQRDGEDFMVFMTRADKEYDKLVAEAKKVNTKKTYVGVILKFQHADGYAIYRVARDKPLVLEHIPVGDAWRVPPYAERGISVADIKQQIKWDAFCAKQYKAA